MTSEDSTNDANDKSYDYDDNGSQISVTSSAGTDTYGYDLRNKLISATVNGQVVSYVYDDAENRVQETVNGVTTYYLTDTNNLTGYAQPIEEKTSLAGAPTRTYILADHVLAQVDSAGVVTYLMTDGHGSTRALIDSTGAVTDTLDYKAFGGAIDFDPATIGVEFQYAGDAIYDAATGLYLHGNGVRPRMGFRFIQMDSRFAEAGDLVNDNLYIYAANNAPNANDPSGRFFAIVAPTLGFSASIFRDLLDPGRNFHASWGIGRALTESINFDTCSAFALADIAALPAQLQLMDIMAEAHRGLGAVGNAAQLTWDAIYETFDLNEQIFLDLIISPFFASACFAAGTPIVTAINADGSYTTKAIEDVQAGDCVLARDEHDVRAEARLRRVNEVFSRETDYLRILTIQDERGNRTTIHTTDGHLIWIAGRGWTKAGNLQVGDRLCDTYGKENVIVLVSERENLPEPVRVYTFRVEADHTYFVSDAIGTGQLAAWVHNVCSGAAAYEEAMRAEKGVAGQARDLRKYPIAGKFRYADAIFVEKGTTVAGEAKYVGNWAKSIYNPVSNVGSRSFAAAVRQGVVKQSEDYLAGGFSKVVLRTNSQEFINYYSQEFAKAGILNKVVFELKP